MNRICLRARMPHAVPCACDLTLSHANLRYLSNALYPKEGHRVLPWQALRVRVQGQEAARRFQHSRDLGPCCSSPWQRWCATNTPPTHGRGTRSRCIYFMFTCVSTQASRGRPTSCSLAQVRKHPLRSLPSCEYRLRALVIHWVCACCMLVTKMFSKSCTIGRSSPFFLAWLTAACIPAFLGTEICHAM